ncbi:MAG: SMC family ATPase [Bacteroidota bacterium]|nr:SMC family ATPase [Bacteroidota bacterium]
MVPVSLRLTNFLSYGSQATELDFSRFQVACLSGANGQGKSALLDAITWAVWGKTERGRGHAALVRTGSEQEPMRVEFVFDIEHARYRVVRIYEKGLHRVELHQAEEKAGDIYRLLSGTGVKETQRSIEVAVGLDYATFINSAYLLQGRSNEFARGSAGERKEILGKILNLQRYERLREQATREKIRAQGAVQGAETLIEQLTGQIDKAPRLQSRYRRLTGIADKRSRQLSRIGTKLQQLVRRLSQLESWESLADNLAVDITQLGERIETATLEKMRVEALAAKADALIDQADVLRERFGRKTVLERDLHLEERNLETHMELVQRRDELEKELAHTRNSMERKLAELTGRRDLLRQRLRELDQTEARRPGIQAQLARAREAQSVADELRITKGNIDRLQHSISTCSLEIEKERLALRARVKSLNESVRQLQQQHRGAASLRLQRDILLKRLQGRAELEARLKATEGEGLRVKAERDTLTGKIAAWDVEKQERAQQIKYLEETESGNCPTCGIGLTPTHRAQAIEELKMAERLLGDSIAEGQRIRNQLEGDIRDLRARYTDQASQLKLLNQGQEELAVLDERIKGLEINWAQAKKQAAESSRIQLQLQEKNYKQEVRLNLARLQGQLQATDFDNEAFEEAVKRAGEAGPLKNELANIDARLRRKPSLESDHGACVRELDRWERRLQGGARITALSERIAQVGRQIVALGFDHARLKSIREQLSEMSEARQDLVRMEEAMAARPAYDRQKESLEKEIHNTAAKREQKRQDRQSYLNAISGKRAVEESLAEQRQTQHELQQKWGTLQAEIGKVEEKLQQIRHSTRERDKARKKKRSAQEEVVIYGHLQKAFSRRGIPSLIIEQSVNEIEHRANQLLGRLSDGRMHIQIQMLVEKLTGGTRETLEIQVSDELGAYRPYETYSGGEAFRINFALRIALSQLLAARVGVPVRTLVIDEGFGTQDEQGIQSIIEAITKVRRDFAKILIITHLEEVKEAFAVRIEVVKDPVTGSRFNLIGV